MSNGWTGAQYSLFRALFGTGLAVFWVGRAVAVGSSLPVRLACGACALLSVLFAAGIADRIVAGVLGCARLLWPGPLLPAWAPALLVGGVLFAHAALRPAYGTLARRGAPDPGADWRLREPIFAGLWVALSAAYAVEGLRGIRLLATPASPADWPILGLALLFPLLATSAGWRPIAWTGMFALQIFGRVISSADPPAAGLLWPHLLAFDPAWIPPLRAEQPERVFYDGRCALCHAAVRFLLAEDVDGSRFRFAPFESAAFREAATRAGAVELPDSWVLETDAGELLVRSAALIHGGRRLGGLWRVVAEAAARIPERWRDAAYDRLAEVRYLVFGTTRDRCPLATPELRARFLV